MDAALAEDIVKNLNNPSYVYPKIPTKALSGQSGILDGIATVKLTGLPKTPKQKPRPVDEAADKFNAEIMAVMARRRKQIEDDPSKEEEFFE